MFATIFLLVRLNSLIFLAHKIFCHMCTWFFFFFFWLLFLIPMLSTLMIMVGLDGMMYLEWFLYWVFRNSWPLDFISQLEFNLFALQLFDNIPQWKEFGYIPFIKLSIFWWRSSLLYSIIFSSFFPICLCFDSFFFFFPHKSSVKTFLKWIVNQCPKSTR